jgi:beta-glucosidase
MNNKFPKDFLWGAATSAHQVEGNNHNDWTEWEKENALRLASLAQGKQWPDFILKNYPNPLQKENYISGKASDHYNRFREDFDIAKQLGHNAHRFSIEWSRIEPEEGKFNEKEIEHYREVIRALREKGLEPFVTLWQSTNPIWIRDIGGWENSKTPDYFARYIEKFIKSFPDIKYWLTLNEPTVYAGLGYIQGTQPPWVKSMRRGNTVFKNFVSAHNLAYQIIHKNNKNTLVGFAHHLVYMVPKNNLPWNFLATKILGHIRNWRFLNAVKNHCDFIGIQFYQSQSISISLRHGKWGPISASPISGKPLDDLRWTINPEGIYHLLKKMSRYKKPLYITESGLADAKDVYRPKFIEETLDWVSKAIGENVDVRGYFHWSFMDNFEIPEFRGFWPRFGLVEIDYKTSERKIRPSALKYKEIIEGSLS